MYKIILVLTLAFSTYQSSFNQVFYENRNDIPEKYKWDLTTLYKNWNDWESEFIKTSGLLEELEINNEKVIKNSSQLYDVLYMNDSLNNNLVKLYLYAMLQRDIDQNDETVQENEMRISNLFNDFYDASAWTDPYILKINTDTIMHWFVDNHNLNDYEFYYRMLRRDEEHVRSEEIQQLINLFINGYNALDNARSELFYSDIETPLLIMPEGDSIKLNSANINDILANNPDREIRKKALELNNDKFCSKKNTSASLLNGSCEMLYGFSQAYKYSSTLEMFLYSDSIPLSLYSNIVETVKKDTRAIQRYHKIRAKALGLEDYESADKTYNIVKLDKEYDIEMAIKIIKESVKPLGPDYVKKLDVMLNQRKIDMFENEGKVTSMAYSTNYYGNSPFILMNYSNTLTDMFYLIHELGHAIHAMYAMNSQPLSNYESTIFIDEVTSTLNELFLTDYLLNSVKNTDEQIYILQSVIENIEYYFKSTLKADFAYQIFSAVETGQPLTASYLDELYSEIFKEYYGNSLANINPSTWTFFGNLDFYDYQYTSSMITSIIFFNEIKKDRTSASIEKYLDLLKSGGNNYPVAQLKKVGIDITDTKNYTILSSYLSDLVDQYEKALIKGGYIN